MTRKAWFAILFVIAACLFGLAVLPANDEHFEGAPAQCDLYDQRMCEGNLGRVRYCPDTGTQVPWNVPCPNLVFGPDVPGHDDD